CASHMLLAVGITWTAVSIAALCVAMAAFIAHVLTSRATGRPVSRLRSLVYGIVLVAGYSLRTEALTAMAAALLPLLVWVTVRFIRIRYLPRPGALIAFLAPLVIVMFTQTHIPQPRGAEYEPLNDLRGRIHGHAAFGDLDTRAPDVLARAGWSVEEYQDFMYWRFLDDTLF